ncbi:MAG TPA: hypothetical protein VNC50_08040 [Planctomycetia bacterium]|nr:hypothetical protein [Planctomycetia bacterium]
MAERGLHWVATGAFFNLALLAAGVLTAPESVSRDWLLFAAFCALVPSIHFRGVPLIAGPAVVLDDSGVTKSSSESSAGAMHPLRLAIRIVVLFTWSYLNAAGPSILMAAGLFERSSDGLAFFAIPLLFAAKLLLASIILLSGWSYRATPAFIGAPCQLAIDFLAILGSGLIPSM